MRTSLKLAGSGGHRHASTSPRWPLLRSPRLVGPAFASIGPLAFGPRGVFFAAGPSGRDHLRRQSRRSRPGAATGHGRRRGHRIRRSRPCSARRPRKSAIADFAVHPASQELVRRRSCAAWAPPLSRRSLRVDGAGKIDVLSLDRRVKFTSVALPNPAAVSDDRSRRPRAVGDRPGVLEWSSVRRGSVERGVRLEALVGGLSLPRPIAARASRSSTATTARSRPARRSWRSCRSPSTTSRTSRRLHLHAAREVPVSALKPGEKVVGTTMAELGAGNQPLDMIAYQKDGQQFLLMSNSWRGVMKIPTAGFAAATPITAPVPQGGPRACASRRSPA